MVEAESTTSTSTGSDGNAAAATPAAETPATEISDNAAETTAVDNTDNWSELSGPTTEGDDVEVPVAEPAAAPVKPAAAEVKPGPVKPAAPATEPAKPAETPAAAAPAEPKPGEPAAPAKKPETATAETPEAKTAREAAEAAEDARLTNGLEEYYKLPDDLAAQLITEPEVVLPKLAAQVHRAIAIGTQRLIAQQLPQVIDMVLRGRDVEAQSKQAFYSRWPELAQHEEQVFIAGEMYNRLNPNASTQDRIEKIGKLVMDSLGIAAAAAPAGGAPARPVVPANTGFRPAGTNASAGAARPALENEFEAMAEDEE